MPDSPPPTKLPWVGLSAVGVGVFMATLDGSIVNVALPTLRQAFHVRVVTVEWVVSGYLLVVSALLSTLGRLGDLFGYRSVFVWGFLGFTAGSALCATAHTILGLLVARAFQAVGAGALLALGPGIVTDLFPASRRGQALGAISSIVAAGLTAGPPLGGFLLERLSWRWIFTINIPVGIAGALYARRVLPPMRESRGARFDLPGAFLFGLAIVAFTAGISLYERFPERSLLLVAGSVVVSFALFRWERRVPSPLLPWSVFRIPIFSFGIASGLLAFTALFASTLLVPFYLSQVRGLPPRAMGLVLTSVPLALSVVSPFSGKLSDRIGSKGLCAAGLAVASTGLGSLALAGPGDPLWTICARLAVVGSGMGLFQPPNNSRVMGSLPKARLGSGGGVLATARNLGMVLGVATAGTLFASRARGRLDPASFLSGFSLALGVAAAVALAGALLSLAGTPAEPLRKLGDDMQKFRSS